MLSSAPYQPTRTITGIITAITHASAWSTQDRHEIADITIDGAEPFHLIGRTPEEFVLRKPRTRPIDAATVASLQVGDTVRVTYTESHRGVQHLTLIEQSERVSDEVEPTDLSRFMAMIGF